MPKTILIVDDSDINREILRRMLCEQYSIALAENGQEAMVVLHQSHQQIAAVLLDLVMPVMDGYTVLERMHDNPALAQIPVIVISGSSELDVEKRALALGANDFVTKPFDADILRRRLSNLIKLRETSAMINTLQKDRLTGVWNRETFFQKAEWAIRRMPVGYYILGCVDIDNFKLINDRFGTEKGDVILKLLARTLNATISRAGGMCGRISADNFVMLYPRTLADEGTISPSILEQQVFEREGVPVSLSVGRYYVVDKTLPVAAMYDRAIIAQNTVKGRFDAHVAVYNESMRSRIIREQEIINSMSDALSSGQFEPWFQPQYNHATGARIGAEALCRWRHPSWGLVSPAEFIPVFERNGFVYELDKCIWEQVCRLLRRWTDEGRDPLPVSINISRYDLYRGDLLEVITGLTEQYGIPADLLRLEITESAFSESTDAVVTIVKQLITHGFTVEIDDFGSGYSSLNTLKDVPAQILKMDMRFLDSGDDSDRGGNILESIVRMAKWIGMSVIAEGVETQEQADYLKSIGCNYVQGFLYSRPMSLSEYEQMSTTVVKEERLIKLETVENLDNNAFWNPASMDTLIFNSYVGSACIFELANGRVELLRATDKFPQMLGNAGISVSDMLKVDLNACLGDDERRKLITAVHTSAETLSDVTEDILFLNLPGCPERTYLRSTLRVIATVGERSLVYCTNQNITARMETERKLHLADERLHFLNEVSHDLLAQPEVDIGIDGVLHKILTFFGADRAYIIENDDEEQTSDNTYEVCRDGVSSQMAQLHGIPYDANRTWFDLFERGDYVSIDSVADLPDERKLEREILLRQGIAALLAVPFTRDGKLLGFIGVDNPTKRQAQADQLRALGDYLAVMLTRRDLTLHIDRERRTLLTTLSDMPGGFGRMRVKPDGHATAVYVNDGLCRMLGTSREDLLRLYSADPLWGVHPDDTMGVLSMYHEALATGNVVTAQYRLRHGSGGHVWVSVSCRATGSAGERHINLYYADLTAEESAALSVRGTMPIILSAIMKSSNDLAFAKDKSFRYICCTPAFAKMAGQRFESDIVGKTDYQLFDKKTADQFRADDLTLMRSGESLIDYTEPIPSDDGKPHYSVTSKYILRDSTGEVVGLYGLGRDVTDTRAALDRLQTVNDSIPGGMASFTLTADGAKLVYYNDGFCRMIGCTREEFESLSGNDPMTRVFEEDLPALREQIARMYRDGTPIDCTYRNRLVGGNGFIWIHFRGEPVERYRDTVFVNALLLDVTERMNAEQSRREAETQLEAVMTNVAGGVAAITMQDGAPRYVFMNARYHDMFGYTREEFEAMPLGLASIIHQDDSANVAAFTNSQNYIQHEFTSVFRVICRDGSVKWVRAAGSVCRIESIAEPVHIVVLYDITDERVATERLQTVVAQIASGITAVSVHEDGTVEPLLMADRYFELLGYTREQFSAETSSLFERVHPDDRERVENTVRQLTEVGQQMTVSFRIIRRDGAERWLRVDIKVIRYPGVDRPVQLSVFTDVTDSRTAEEQLQLLTDNIPGGIASYTISDGDIRVRYYNDGFLNLFGVTRDQYHGIHNATAFLFPEDMPLLQEQIDRLLEHGTNIDCTFRARRYDNGQTVWINLRGMLSEQRAGTAYVNTVLFDVTDRIRIEHELRGASERLQMIMDHAGSGIRAMTIRNGKTQYLFANDRFYDLLGYTREQHLKKNRDPFSVVHPKDRKQAKAAILAANHVGDVATLLFRVQRPDRQTRWMRAHITVTTFNDVDVPVQLCVYNDVTQTMLFEQQLRQSEEQFRIATDMSGAIIGRYDIRTHCYTHNSDKLISMGLPPMIENVPQAFVDSGTVTEDTAPALIDLYSRLGRGESPVHAQANLKYPDGKFRWSRVEGTVILDDDGQPAQAIVVTTDISEQLEKESIYLKWQQSMRNKPLRDYTLFRTNISKNAPVDSQEGELLRLITAIELPFPDRCCIYAERRVHPDDCAAYLELMDSDTLLASYHRGQRSKTLDYREIDDDGSERWLRVTVELVEYPNSKDVEAYVLTENIDEHKREELSVRSMAANDPLTGVFNRATFTARMSQLLRERSADAETTLFMIDVDAFKQLNDTFGHAAGDQALVDMASDMRAILRAGDLLGRLGGDEFVVCLRDMMGDASIENKARQFCSLLRKPYGADLLLSASIGIAVCPRDGDDFDTLYRHADTALYAVKAHGKDNYAFYTPAMEEENFSLGPNKHASPTRAAAKSAKRRMLIVDDNKMDLETLSALFEDEYLIERAKNADAAMVCLKHYGTSITVVLLDLIMPVTDGFSVLERMQQSAELKTVPVIVVSASEERESVLRAIRTGATDYVSKPVDPEILRIRVQSAVSRAENERLRAQNSRLVCQSSEVAKYRAALAGLDTVTIEYNWQSGVFTYDPKASRYLLGHYDGRTLWRIFLSDFVTDVKQVQQMQRLVHNVANDREASGGSLTVTLKTPASGVHRFVMRATKLTNEFGLTDRIILTFTDQDREPAK